MTDHEITISSAPTTLVTFDLTVEQITAMGKQYLELTCTDTATRTECGKARKTLVSTRTGIGKRQKELKQPLKDDMKRIDEAADLLVAALAPIEAHLDAQIDAYEAAKKAEKEARELAEKQANEARIAAAMAEAAENVRIAQEAMAAREAAYVAEVARQKEELEREKAELARHRAAIEAERSAAIAAHNAEVERVEAAAKAERERVAAEKAEADRIAAAEQAEVDRKNAEAQARIETARQELRNEQDRLAAIRIAQERAEADRVAAAQAEADRLAREEAERVDATFAKIEQRINQHTQEVSQILNPACVAGSCGLPPDGPTLVDVAIPVDAENVTAEQSDAARLVAYLAALRAVPVPDMSTESGRNVLGLVANSFIYIIVDVEAFAKDTNV